MEILSVEEGLGDERVIGKSLEVGCAILGYRRIFSDSFFGRGFMKYDKTELRFECEINEIGEV